jgi:hypothetical protein
MLSAEDLKDLKSMVYEIHEQLFAHKIDFYPFDVTANATPSIPPTIYKEKKDKKYLSPIQLIGKANLKVDSQEVSPVGVVQKYDSTFEISTLELESKNILGVFTEEVMNKSRFKYQGTWFDILYIEPSTESINDVFLAYTFKTKKVVGVVGGA